MKKIINLYLHQHLEQVAAAVLGSIVLGVVFAFLDKNADYIYFGILGLAVYVLFFVIHFLKNLPLYQSLLSEVESEEDFWVSGNSPLAQLERTYLRHLRSMYLGKMRMLQEENKNYKIMMNKWVHQMKTPLSVLHMFAQQEKGTSAEMKRQELEHMNELLNQVLNLMRMENFEKDFSVKCCQLEDLLKAAVNQQKNYFIQKEIYPQMHVCPDIYVYTDERWLVFAIQQFLNNAVKYSEPGSTVEVKSYREGNRVALEICDCGCGILPEDQKRIFDFCFTGSNGRKKQKESSGLGLYLAKYILDRLGHEVRVYSKVGKGTKVCLFFEMQEV